MPSNSVQYTLALALSRGVRVQLRVGQVAESNSDRSVDACCAIVVVVVLEDCARLTRAANTDDDATSMNEKRDIFFSKRNGRDHQGTSVGFKINQIQISFHNQVKCSNSQCT